MRLIRGLISFTINFILGIILPAVILTQLTGKKAIYTGQEVGVGYSLDTFGILAWFLVILIYFIAGKYFLGKSLGGKIADTITGKKD